MGDHNFFLQDDPELEEYNVDDRVKQFVQAVTTQNSYYSTGHVMLTMGSDFQYESAIENYLNMDKLITYVNAKVESELNLSFTVFFYAIKARVCIT